MKDGKANLYELAIAAPKPVLAVMAQLHDADYEAFIVGGCVRDALLGLEPHDWDMTTNATPAQMKEAVGFRSIDTGLKHGTITFLVDGEPIETTTYRTDGTYSDGRHPDSIAFARTLEEDLARRDFTVNAMAWAPQTGVVDPFDGTQDLQNRLLRCVGDARERFSEDGLRVMRALRFAAVYGFDIEEATAQAVHDRKWMLQAVSAERISTELAKMMRAPDGRHLAKIADEFADVLFQVIPELAPTWHFDQENPYHDRDLWTHLLDTMAAVEPDPDLRLAALLHDIGKPSVKTKGDDGIAHYLGHAEAGAAIVEPLLRRLKFSRRVIDEVTFLVAQHDHWPSATKKSARRFLARCGDEPTARKVLALMKADRAAHSEKLSVRSIDSLDGVERYLDAVLAENTAFSVKDLAVSGDDLLAMGWPESPALGAELSRLFDLVLAGDVPNERDALLAAIRACE